MRKIYGAIISLTVVISLLAGPMPAAWAKEPATPKLSLKDAVQKAFDASPALKAAQASVDKTAKQRSDVAAVQPYIPGEGINANPVNEIAFKSLVTTSINWETAKKSLAQQQDSITLDVLTQYYNIISCQDTVNRAQADLARDERALAVARASYAVGLITNASLMGAEAKEKASRKALEVAKNELDKAYIVFNQLVGLWPEDRPELTDPLTFTPLQVDNLDTDVERAVTSSKDVFKLQQLLAIAKLSADYPYSLDSTTGQPVYTSRDISQYDVDTAQQNLNIGADTVRQKVRTLYKDILEGEQQYESLQAALKTAEENLRVQKLMYALGLTTLDKVKQAEADVMDTKNSITLLTYKHQVQVANYRLLIGDTIID